MQAFLSCFAGSVVCLWSCTRNFLHSSHFMSEAYAWFGAAYFFYDIWSMYQVHISIGVPFNHTSEKTLKKISQASKDRENHNSSADRKNGVSCGDGTMQDKTKADFKVVQSFLSYCREQPIIIMHHLFIGGFGFLVIVVSGITIFL